MGDKNIRERAMMDIGAESELKPSILVIEDDWGMAELIEMMLQSRGYDVQRVNSGVKAIALLEEMAAHASRWQPFPIDLILLDIMIPGMDGFKVCQVLKEHALLRYVPVIMLTALDSMGDKLAAVQFGADDYITKPFLPEELDAAIKAKLQVKNREDALLRRNAELETIDAVGTAASSSLDTDRVAKEGFAALMDEIDVCGAIYILDVRQNSLRRVAQRGIVRPESLSAGEGLSREVLQSQDPVYRGDVEPGAVVATGEGDAVPLRAFIGVPLRVDNRSLGILELYHTEPYGFDEGMLSFLSRIGKRLGMALQNAELFGQAQLLLLESSSLSSSGT
jgi:two-component system response regulator VanR